MLVRCVLVATLSLFAWHEVIAQVTFTKIVDESDPIPNVGSAFSGGFSDPVATGGAVLFGGSNFTSSARGIYTSAGGVTPVADLQTPVPGGGGNFSTFQSFDASGGNVAFEGNGAGRNGIYSTAGGLHTVADTTDLIPGTASTFSSFTAPTISGSDVAFIGGRSNTSGVYVETGGTLTTIVDSTTNLPGNPAEQFTLLDSTNHSVSISGGEVAFLGIGNVNFVTGLYRGSVGGVSLLVDLNTSLPGGGGNFNSFKSTPQIDGNRTLFEASGPGLGGIFSAATGNIATIVDTNTLAPGGSNYFGFGLFSADSNAVAFEAFVQGGPTILYYHNGNSISQLLAPGDVVDSQTVSSVSIGEGALSGTQLAVKLTFNNGNSGIYVAQVPAAVPEPASVVLLTCLALAGFVKRKAP